METSIININCQKGNTQRLVREVSETIKQIARDIHKESDLCIKMQDMDIDTSLANDIKKVFQNPYNAIVEQTRINNSIYRNAILYFFIRLFEATQEAIYKIYLIDSDTNELFFYIVPEEDNLLNREMIYCALDAYEGLEVSKYFPVIFQIAPKEIVTKLVSYKEIPFSKNEHRTS